MRSRPLALLCAAVVTVLGAALLMPTSAQAYGYPLETPSGEHLITATPTSFTIGVNTAPHALAYRVYTSTSREALYAANVTSHTKQATSSKPVITVGSLTYTTATYWYRVMTIHGTSYRWGAIYGTGVRPPMPTGLHVTNSTAGLHLDWTAGSASTYVIRWATDAAMTQNVVTRIYWNHGTQYSPEGLAKGVPLYFTIAARNHGAWSTFSAQVSATPVADQQSVVVQTYNILQASTAGTATLSGGVFPSWTTRRAGVAALINVRQADAVAIEEGGNLVSAGTRQVDDLVRYLPGYAVARTETPPSEGGTARYNSYVLYRTAAYQPYGAGGHWALDTGHYAAYQVLQNRTSGAKFLFVAAHLVAGHSTALDSQRATETSSLLRQAGAVAASYRVPVVYGGDFNSTTGTTYVTDGPGNVMRDAGQTDTRLASVMRYNESYNSANQYLRTPILAGHSIDHVYAGPGVTTWSWGVQANLVKGSFVGTIPSDHDPVWAHLTVPY